MRAGNDYLKQLERQIKLNQELVMEYFNGPEEGEDDYDYGRDPEPEPN